MKRNREICREKVESIPESQRNVVPNGFKNSLLWQIGRKSLLIGKLLFFSCRSNFMCYKKLH